jgi:hypothetical protein
MARSHGFRLYEVQLFRGRKQSPQSFALGDEHYADHLERVVQDHLLAEKFDHPPSLDHFVRSKEPDEVEGDEDEPSVLFEVEELGRHGTRVRIKYRSGSVGSYALAVSRRRGDPDVDVSEHAVLSPQRAWFLLPAEGLTGLLVAESVGRASGENMLQRWLHAASRADRAPEAHWRLALTGVGDPEHMQALLDEESMEEIVLLRHEEQPDRSTTVEPFKIQSKLKSAYAKRSAAQTAMNWFERRSNPLSTREGARQLAAILDPSLAKVDFNDGYIKASAEDTSGQQLRPDLAKDIFTYRLGPGVATEARVLGQAREVVEGISKLSDLDLPWP